MTAPTPDVGACVAAGPIDLIVVGAGPAGLTLASELVGAAFRVLIVDAGDAKSAHCADDLRGEVAAGSYHPSPDLYRSRGLGGTSRIWGGRSTPLDAIDFENRPWISSAGWPISFQDIAAHYPKAFDICEAGDGSTDPSQIFPPGQTAAVEGLDPAEISTTIERFSRPTNFWKRLRAKLVAADNVGILTGAPVIRVLTRRDGSAVEGVEVGCGGGERHRLEARAVVLAAGGLEVPRLLLNSRDVWTHGIGNAYDQVGRHYMAHICMTFGVLELRPGIVARFNYDRDQDGVYIRRRLWPAPKIQRRNQLLNAIFRAHLPDPSDPIHRDGVLSAMFLAKSFVQREYAERFAEAPVKAAQNLRHFLNIAQNLPDVARFSAMWASRRILSNRKLPSVERPARDGHHFMEVLCEQSPDPLSRVGLDASTDRFGEQRLLLNWRFNNSDAAALSRTLGTLEKAVRQADVGRLTVLTSGIDSLAERARRLGVFTGHHMGTTRMAADPRRGVVDADCCVHGVANLFVASSAVFATSGQANPTLSIVAFSLRLAAHLRRELARPSITLEEAA